MKTQFSLQEAIQGRSSLLTMLFNSADFKTVLDPIFKQRVNMSSEEADKQTVEMILTINGTQYDLQSFLDKLESIFDEIVTATAQELIRERTSEKLEKLEQQINELKQSVDSYTDSINFIVDEK